MIDRVKGRAAAKETPIGLVPTEAPSTGTASTSAGRAAALLHVDRDEWAAEVPEIRAFFDRFGDAAGELATLGAERLRGRVWRGRMATDPRVEYFTQPVTAGERTRCFGLAGWRSLGFTPCRSADRRRSRSSGGPGK